MALGSGQFGETLSLPVRSDKTAMHFCIMTLMLRRRLRTAKTGFSFGIAYSSCSLFF
jgi:hypothetical protein